jgi:hypothetical protein
MGNETITITVTLRRNIAAVAAAWIAGRPTDHSALAAYPETPEAWLQRVVDSACYSYRDQYLSDAVTSAAFLLRFTSAEMEGIRAAAQGVQELADWLSRIENIGLPGSPDRYVWLGSDEVQEGKAQLVGGALLTQERADVIFFYAIPEPSE